MSQLTTTTRPGNNASSTLASTARPWSASKAAMVASMPCSAPYEPQSAWCSSQEQHRGRTCICCRSAMHTHAHTQRQLARASHA